MNAVAPITVPPVVTDPDPPARPLAPLVVRNPYRSGLDCWIASYSSLTLAFRRRAGVLVMALDHGCELRRFEAPGDGPLTWAEVCEIAGIADATPD